MPHPTPTDTSISVIIPTYNRAGYLGRAIRSAMRQVSAADEIIVVDDGSTDNTRELAAPFGDAVRYIYTPNGGAGRARNIGIAHATKPLVAFLDSDDEWFDGKLDMQRRLMAARPDVLFSFSNFAVTLKSGERIHRYLRHWLKDPMPWEVAVGPGQPFSAVAALPHGVADFPVHIGDLSAAEMVDNYVLTSSLVVRRVEAGEALQFANDLKFFEDWYCFARLAMRGTAAYLDCETAWQHGMAESRLSDAGTVARAETWNTINQRVWAANDEFRQRHAALYERRLKLNRLSMARGLFSRGDSQLAREVLSDVADPPLSYRLLAQMPGGLVRFLNAARRRFIAPAG